MPIPPITAPNMTVLRGPIRSTTIPVTTPIAPPTIKLREKPKDNIPLVQPNSSSNTGKNTPKVKVAAPLENVASQAANTITQP